MNKRVTVLDLMVPSQIVLKSIRTQVNSFSFWSTRTHRFGQFVLIWSIRIHYSVNSYSFLVTSYRSNYRTYTYTHTVKQLSPRGNLLEISKPNFWEKKSKYCVLDCLPSIQRVISHQFISSVPSKRNLIHQ